MVPALGGAWVDASVLRSTAGWASKQQGWHVTVAFCSTPPMLTNLLASNWRTEVHLHIFTCTAGGVAYLDYIRQLAQRLEGDWEGVQADLEAIR